MEVHSHTHTERKKWHHYFWEFFMLFLAVTLGFLVENIREKTVEHKRAKEYAAMLKADLINDTLQLQKFISKADEINKDFDQLKMIIKKDHHTVTLNDLNFLMNGSFDLEVFVRNDATYSQMKFSGSLRYFENMTLLGKLAAYEAQIKKFETDWSNTREFFGGISSQHFLEFAVHSEKFISSHPDMPATQLIEPAGYNFQSWDETCQIFNILLWFISGVNDTTYPKLKQTAVEIIDLLNKKYHLKL
jgi:hypothetical protein